jgi:hypothetical protein
MLSREFSAQVCKIFTSLPCEVQITVFSATAKDILEWTRTMFLRNPFCVTAGDVDPIKHYYVAVEEDSKIETLCELLEEVPQAKSVVCCNVHHKMKWLNEALQHKISCISLSSDMTREERLSALASFRDGVNSALITTDRLARDIRDINVVINFDLPSSHENYLGRIPRTWRRACKGVVINLATAKEAQVLRQLEATMDELPMDFAVHLDCKFIHPASNADGLPTVGQGEEVCAPTVPSSTTSHGVTRAVVELPTVQLNSIELHHGHDLTQDGPQATQASETSHKECVVTAAESLLPSLLPNSYMCSEVNPLFYKTMICTNVPFCRFGALCNYAHGNGELRTVEDNFTVLHERITRGRDATVTNGPAQYLAPVPRWNHGQPPKFWARDSRLQSIMWYKTPADILAAVSNGHNFQQQLLGTLDIQCLNEVDSSGNDPRPKCVLHALAYAEEAAVRFELQRYRTPDATIQRSENLTDLTFIPLKDLSERRPSVMVGDKVVAECTGQSRGRLEGYVHRIMPNGIAVDFGKEVFRWLGDLGNVGVDLQILYKARTEAVLHDSIEKYHDRWLRLLQPSPRGKQVLTAPRGWNVESKLNQQQLNFAYTAVMRQQQPPGDILMLWGPPGTGKTTTLVQTIAAVLRTPGTNVLVCAPSNFACDVIAERLIPFLPEHAALERVVGFTRNTQSMPAALQRHVVHPSSVEQVTDKVQWDVGVEVLAVQVKD